MAVPLEGIKDCYRKSTLNGQIVISNTNAIDGVCPGTETSDGNYKCCDLQDVCLGYGICHSDIPIEGGSGLYVSGCTDPDYRSSACPQMCTTEALPDIVYNNSASLWKCCGTTSSGTVNCGDPTNMSFGDPSVEQILQTSSNDTNQSTTLARTSLPATSTSTTASSATNTVSNHSVPSSSAVLSKGAEAGIIVTSVIAVLALSMLAFVLVRRPRRSNIAPSRVNEIHNFPEWKPYIPSIQAREAPPDNFFRRSEMPTNNERHSPTPNSRGGMKLSLEDWECIDSLPHQHRL